MIKQTKTHDLYDLALRDRKMMPVFAIGCAGTGKTYQAIKAAYEALDEKRVRKIVCLRPRVPYTGHAEHALPGSEREKLEPWAAPILDNLLHFTNKGELECLEKHGKLQFRMLDYAQGITYDNTFIIVDEAQNMTYQQIKGLMTRIGRYSKIVIAGDIAQTSPKFKGSGLGEWVELIERMELPFHSVEFTKDDVLRSDVCKMVIDACDKWEGA